MFQETSKPISQRMIKQVRIFEETFLLSTRIFYGKPKILAGAESFLQLSDFEYSEFLMSFSEFLKDIRVHDLSLREHFKTRFF